MSKPIFVGLDLAWSPNNNTGGAAIEWDEADERGRLLDYREQLGSNDQIIEWVGQVAPAERTSLVAIDAPLVVPNMSGARAGDKLITKVFGRYQAGTHPANRTNLGRYGQPVGDIRGETLTARLVNELTFQHNPYVERQSQTRQVFECYPHPAMVVLFELTTTLKYKRKLKSLDNDRHAAYQTLQSHLGSLSQRQPALDLPADLLKRDTRQMRGLALKHYEDLLDGCMCAYIALYYWWWGPERVAVFGDMASGYIVSPVTPQMYSLATDEQVKAV